MMGSLRWLLSSVVYIMASYGLTRDGEVVAKRRLALMLGLVGTAAAGVPVPEEALTAMWAGFYIDGLGWALPAMWRTRPQWVRLT